MANPQIGEQVSAKLLNRVFASKRKPSSAASDTRVKSPQPHADRIVIDPLTGKGDDATHDRSLRPFDTRFGAGTIADLQPASGRVSDPLARRHVYHQLHRQMYRDVNRDAYRVVSASVAAQTPDE
jgi:hypothetical protein